MALMDEDDVSYRDDEEDSGQSFEDLSKELFPDADPDKVKQLIRLCYEEDKERDEEPEHEHAGSGIALLFGKPKGRG